MAAEAEFMALQCDNDEQAERIRAAAQRAKQYSLSLFDEAATSNPMARPLIDRDGNVISPRAVPDELPQKTTATTTDGSDKFDAVVGPSPRPLRVKSSGGNNSLRRMFVFH
jgi:hypothetical protein